jgi:hypothetical protein
MKTTRQYLLLFLCLPIFQFHHTPSSVEPAWGFFAHKRINRLAVFTLPEPLLPLFKKEIEFLTEHAIDPDRRRYVVPTEGYRHYINLDRWFFLPQDKTDAQILHTEIFLITDKQDTLTLVDDSSIRKAKRDYYLKARAIKRLFGRDSIVVADSNYRRFFLYNLSKIQPDDPLSISLDSLSLFFKKEGLPFNLKNDKGKTSLKAAFARDKLSPNGIVPYHLFDLQRQLTQAFIAKNKSRVLKLAAEMGHYIADAHSPLHTTSNYDGQFTNQNGIHAFWESHLPQLFADNQYDFFVGAAQYIEQPRTYFWAIVKQANTLVEPLLQMEKEVSAQFPADKKYCLEVDNGGTIQKPCFDFSRTYHDRLGGMVEAQMRRAILAIGSAWYTAWIDAGQPSVSDFKDLPFLSAKGSAVDSITEQKEQREAEKQIQSGKKMLGRPE